MVDLFRYVGAGYKKPLKAKGKTGQRKPQIFVRSYSKDLMTVFDIDVASDAVEIHHQMFCIVVRAKGCQTPYKCTHTYWIRVKYGYNSPIYVHTQPWHMYK